MTVREAYAIVRRDHLNQECASAVDFGDFWGFDFAPEGCKKSDLYGGGYDAIDKDTGERFGFSPTQNFSLFRSGKEVPDSEYYDGARITIGNYYKNDEEDKVWWKKNTDEYLISFDRKKDYDLFRDYPDKLTAEERKIFDQENPLWKDLLQKRA